MRKGIISKGWDVSMAVTSSKRLTAHKCVGLTCLAEFN
jgi:hypothetical protein